MLGIGDQRKYQDRSCAKKMSLEDTGHMFSGRTCEPSTWGFRGGGEGRLKKKKEKGTEMGKESVRVILRVIMVALSPWAYLPWSSSAKDQHCRAENISMTLVIPLVLAQSQPALSLWWHREAFPLSASEQCFLPWQPHTLSTEIKHHFWHVVIGHICEIQSSISIHIFTV